MISFEHVNLVVTDIDASLRFYHAALPHWRERLSGESDWYGKPRRWLHFGDDYQYLTLNDNGEGVGRDLQGHQPGLAHFAFVTDDIDGVIARLGAEGFAVAKDGAEEPFRRNVYFIDPDGMEVEFVQYMSDDPAERNRPS